MPTPSTFLNTALKPVATAAHHLGLPLSQSAIQPFIELERDRNRARMAQMFAGPLGAAATHMAPIVPQSVHGIAGAGNLPISTAVPQMFGMANPAMDAGGIMAEGLGQTLMGNLGPVLAMGALGAGGAVAGAYGVSKLVNALIRRRQRNRMQRFNLGIPKMGAIHSVSPEGEEAMFSDLRFVKFAAAGALGYEVPEDFREAIEKAAFTLGMMHAFADRSYRPNNAEAVALEDLSVATKKASHQASDLRNRLKVKVASNGSTKVSLDEIRQSCEAKLPKVAATKKVRGGIGEVFFNTNSKVARALEFLGLDETALRVVSGGKQISGTGAGLVGLLA